MFKWFIKEQRATTVHIKGKVAGRRKSVGFQDKLQC